MALSGSKHSEGVTTVSKRQRLLLCAGLQSGGTTIVSWCFLQRSDTNGILDAHGGIIQTDFERVTEPVVWVKQTISALRWLDLAHVYRDLGWKPEPLLVVRDVRAAFASLMTKEYGFNGVTLDEPPLRLRFRRFLADWELFREQGWPILVFEEFLRDPHRVLIQTCEALGLPYAEDMLTWPKSLADIAYVFPGQNRTFATTIEQGSAEGALLSEPVAPDLSGLPASELDWLEETFAAYNSVHGYLPAIDRAARPQTMPPPRYEGTPHQRLRAKFDSLSAEYEVLRRHVLRLEIEAVVPAGARLALVDKGTPLELADGRSAVAFPQINGGWAGYPADDAEAIAELQRLRGQGIRFVAIPQAMRYWLETYPTWASYLREGATTRVDNERALIFELP
jgi:hypothetical protein